MSLFLGDPSASKGLKLSTLTYEKSIRSKITVNGIIDAPGIATIAGFVAVQSTFEFEAGWDIRMLAATPNVIRYTYKGGDKNVVANYGGPVPEGVGVPINRTEIIIPPAVNITIPHDDNNWFSTVIHAGGMTTLDNISNLLETGLQGTLKITNTLGNSFLLGPAIDEPVSEIGGFFNNTKNEMRLAYYLSAGKLYLNWIDNSSVQS